MRLLLEAASNAFAVLRPEQIEKDLIREIIFESEFVTTNFANLDVLTQLLVNVVKLTGDEGPEPLQDHLGNFLGKVFESGAAQLKMLAKGKPFAPLPLGFCAELSQFSSPSRVRAFLSDLLSALSSPKAAEDASAPALRVLLDILLPNALDLTQSSSFPQLTFHSGRFVALSPASPLADYVSSIVDQDFVNRLAAFLSKNPKLVSKFIEPIYALLVASISNPYSSNDTVRPSRRARLVDDSSPVVDLTAKLIEISSIKVKTGIDSARLKTIAFASLSLLALRHGPSARLLKGSALSSLLNFSDGSNLPIGIDTFFVVDASVQPELLVLFAIVSSVDSNDETSDTFNVASSLLAKVTKVIRARSDSIDDAANIHIDLYAPAAAAALVRAIKKSNKRKAITPFLEKLTSQGSLGAIEARCLAAMIADTPIEPLFGSFFSMLGAM